MVERDLLDAFDDCIDRLGRGSSVEECVRLYPQYATTLRTMLETGIIVKRAQPDMSEILLAQDRVESRILRALETPRPQRIQPYRRLLSLAAAMLLILFVGGTGLVAQGSLPGDTLYGFKRFTESVVGSVSGAGQEQFAQRRIDEVRQLLALQRSEEVTFQGMVEIIDGTTWLVAGLPLTVEADTPDTTNVQVGDRVEVDAYTTPTQELIALRIRLIDDNTPELVPTVTPTLEATEIPSTPTTTPSPTVMQTNTAQPSSTPTATPTSTLTPTPQASATRTPEAVTASPTACVAAAPSGWVSYRIQAGDTLSALSSNTGATLEEVLAANCIEDARRIIAGQAIFLPRTPTVAQPTLAPTTASNSSGGNSNTGNSGGSSSNSGSGSGGSSGSSSNDNNDDDSSDDNSDDDSNDNDDNGED